MARRDVGHGIRRSCRKRKQRNRQQDQFHVEWIGQFLHSGQRTGAPGCVPSALTQRWAFDASTAGGKVMLSGLLAAYAAGKRINVFGTGTCLLWGIRRPSAGSIRNRRYCTEFSARKGGLTGMAYTPEMQNLRVFM